MIKLASYLVSFRSSQIIVQISDTAFLGHYGSLGAMGVDHGGTGGQVPPEFGTGGANGNCPPPRFCHIGRKMSVLWPSKYAKIRFRSGLCPGPRWRAHDALSGLERKYPSHNQPHSARTHRRRSPCVPPRSPARSTPMLFRGYVHCSTRLIGKLV